MACFLRLLHRWRRLRTALISLLVGFVISHPAMGAGVLEKARESGKVIFGYRTDAQPFSYKDANGIPAGFSVALCQRVADALRVELQLPTLAVEFVPVTASSRFDALQQGKIDLLCDAATPTLQRRGSADFSIPIFADGVGALIRSDGSQRLRDALLGEARRKSPIWRGSPGLLSENFVFAVVSGTTIERGLIDSLSARRIAVTAMPVPDYATGVLMVLDRRADCLFGDRPVLLDAAKRDRRAAELTVVERSFTQRPLALAMRHEDNAFRLMVDRTLSRLFLSSEMAPLYTTHFGAPDENALAFIKFNALPE